MCCFHRIHCFAAFTVFLFSGSVLRAQTLQVDIGRTGSALLQSGWQEWNTDGNAFNTTGESTTFAYAETTGGTLNVSLNTTTAAGARNYGVAGVQDGGVSDSANLAAPDVWADLFFFNNNTAGSLALTLGNLKAGTYEITTYHFADNLAAGAPSLDLGIADISVNGADTGLDATMIGAYNGNDPKTAAELEASRVTFQFTVANDGDAVNILYDGLDTNTGSGDSFGLNGFELTLTGPDETDPSIIFLIPGDDTDVALAANLVANFNDAIVPGTGFVTIHEAGGAVFETFNVATSTRLTFSGTGQGSITIDPSSDFASGVNYYLLIDASAIDDAAGNSFAGISDPTVWNFIGDGTAPLGTGSPDLATDGSVSLSFDEEVVKGTGNIVIRKVSDGSVVATIDVTTSSVMISGTTVTVYPGTLDSDTAYYVEIDAGAFADPSGNSFAGFSGSTGWTFTTPDSSLAGVPPFGGTSLGTAFDTWIAQFPAVGTHIGPYHNPDASRFNTFGEFAFDGHPLVRDVEGVFPGVIHTVAGQQVLTYTMPVRDGATFSGGAPLLSGVVDGVSYGIEASRNLSTWDVDVSEVTGADATAIQGALPAPSSGWSYRTFQTPSPLSAEERLFFRAFADDVPARIQQARDSSVIASYALGKVKRWLHEVALPKINSNDLYVAHNGGSARYSSWWNYDDTAADCYPFLCWAAYYTDIDQLNTTDGPVHDVLVAEQLHCNLNTTPGSAFGRVPTAVNTDTLVKEIKSYDNTMFAASEYVKDGLIPIVEVMGKDNPWFDRMQGITDDMWANAQVSTAYGLVPTAGTEADGEQLQALARLYTMTGDTKYLDWGERLADRYLLPGTFVPSSLRDHGSEIIGGLGLFYAVESVHRPVKAATYLAGLQYMLDQVLENGTNADGLMYNSIGGGGLSDSWGYNYVAYLCHDMIVPTPRYSLGLQQTLRNLAKPVYTNYPWEGSSIDGYADSLEGGLYQLNRLAVPEGLAWVDQEMANNVTRTQDPDVNTTTLWGTYKLESNGVRTVLQHAMMHTRGLIARPWELDLELGASQTADGVVITMTSASASGWTGVVQVDKPRYRLEMGFSKDWPRMNTMPEWFTAEPDLDYVVEDINTGTTTSYTGTQLHAGLPVTLDPGIEKLLLIRH
jgi:hypothetical protein